MALLEELDLGSAVAADVLHLVVTVVGVASGATRSAGGGGRLVGLAVHRCGVQFFDGERGIAERTIFSLTLSVAEMRKLYVGVGDEKDGGKDKGGALRAGRSREDEKSAAEFWRG